MKFAFLIFGIFFSLSQHAHAKSLTINLDCGDHGVKAINAYYPVEYSGGDTYWYNGYDEGRFIVYVYHHKVKNFEYASPEAHFYCTKLQ